jgi:hypothetical protein
VWIADWGRHGAGKKRRGDTERWRPGEKGKRQRTEGRRQQQAAAVGGWRSAALEVGGRGHRVSRQRSEVRSQPPSPDGFGAPRRSEDSGQIQSDAAMRRYGDAARRPNDRLWAGGRRQVAD